MNEYFYPIDYFGQLNRRPEYPLLPYLCCDFKYSEPLS